GLGPQRDLARIGQSLVFGGEERLALERNGEAVSFGAQPQGVPLICGDLRADGFDLFPAAVHHTVEPNAAVKCVGADQVVVVWRRKSDGGAAGLVDMPSTWPQVNTDLYICWRESLIYREREAVLDPVCAGVRYRVPPDRSRIRDDFPRPAGAF